MSPKHASWLGLGLALVTAACGGEAELAVQVGFQQHALKCSRDGIKAKLEVIGAPACPLEVNADKEVTGLCVGIPTGQVRQFRLVYFADLPGGTPPLLDLATALETVDLTDQTDPDLLIVFDRIDTYPDDDGSGGTNLEEWCAGTNPRG